MLPGLNELEQFNDKKPSPVDVVLYLFWDKGISYNEFKDLPIPYIMSILQTHNYVKEEEDKAMKKAKRK